jgi:hypothetical protein
MLMKILDFLVNNQFVALSEWSRSYLLKFSNNISDINRNILQALKIRNFDNLIEIIKKQTYTTMGNETYALILKQLEENRSTINMQWDFTKNFNPDKTFINFIVNNQILVYQDAELGSKNQNFSNLQSFKEALSHPNRVSIGGQMLIAKGLSSIDQLQVTLKNSDIKEEYSKFDKYEKIVQFIESVNYNLQVLFSTHQIGIIIFENEIYLIKWVQLLDEDQIITGKSSHQTDVALIEDFGVKIGIQLKNNLELGNLVIFKNREEENNNEPLLRPLLSLEQSIFTSKKKKRKSKWNFSKSDDCKGFVDEVLARIETGILLLNKNKSTFLNNTKDLDIYIKITLQRTEGMKSVNQRINILRDLLRINTNPDNIPNIIFNLEANYLLLLKEFFQQGNVKNLPYILNLLSELNLFELKVNLLTHTLVYLFNSYYVESETILKCVDILMEKWDLSDDLILLLEKPQIVAITNIVIEKLNKGLFNEVISYIIQYLKNHTKFSSYNIYSLLVQIIGNIFHNRHQTEIMTFQNGDYITLLTQFSDLFQSQKATLDATSRKQIKSEFQGTLVTLSNDSNFISYIDDKIGDLLRLFENFDSSLLSKKTFYDIIQNIVDIAPVVLFQKNLHQIGFQVYDYLTKRYKNTEITLEFFTLYANYFTRSTKLLKDNSQLFSNLSTIFLNIRSWLVKNKPQKALLYPLKKEIKGFLEQWYLTGNLPDHNFEIHRNLIHTWVDFVDLRDRLEDMINILYIKDFIWVCNNHDLKKIDSKYKELPKSVLLHALEPLIDEFINILRGRFELYQEFQVVYRIFNILQNDYHIFDLNPAKFRTIVSIFVKNLKASLIFMVQKGDVEAFEDVIGDLQEDLIYITPSFLKEIYQNFIVIYEMNLSEGERFISRLFMLKSLSLQIEKFLPNYNVVYEKKKRLKGNEQNFISFDKLSRILIQFKEGAYQVFRETQNWLSQVCETEYLTIETTFKPVKVVFENILEQFKTNLTEVLKDLMELSKELFQKQKMLNDNKKKFFRMMISLLPQGTYPDFYPFLTDKRDYIEELADIESLYYTIQSDSVEKVQIVKTRVEEILKIYEHLFTPWLINANCLAIQQNYRESIKAYTHALKYESNLGNVARMYHNLLVAMLSYKKYDDAVALVKKLNVGVKTYPHIADIIRKIETLTGIHLLG